MWKATATPCSMSNLINYKFLTTHKSYLTWCKWKQSKEWEHLSHRSAQSCRRLWAPQESREGDGCGWVRRLAAPTSRVAAHGLSPSSHAPWGRPTHMAYSCKNYLLLMLIPLNENDKHWYAHEALEQLLSAAELQPISFSFVLTSEIFPHFIDARNFLSRVYIILDFKL